MITPENFADALRVMGFVKSGNSYELKLPTCEIASRPRKISIQGPERTLCSQVWLETTP